jgi:hypothetical protein
VEAHQQRQVGEVKACPAAGASDDDALRIDMPYQTNNPQEAIDHAFRNIHRLQPGSAGTTSQVTGVVTSWFGGS